jgi:hypothetical protein
LIIKYFSLYKRITRGLYYYYTNMNVAVFLLFLSVAAADLLIGYAPGASNYTFVSSDLAVPALSFIRSRAAFALDSPYGTAIFGPTTSSLLTTSVSNGGVRLCEWNLLSNNYTPVRCTVIGTEVPTDMVYVGSSILVAMPSIDSVISVNYPTFHVEPWMSVDNDATFLAPVALEYDPNGGVVYVALKNADMIRRFSPNGVFIDSSAAPFVSIPRPRFMELARDASPPSLYVLTSDLTLPELYKFRVPDGASLSTLANDDGDWYPEANDSSVRSIAVASDILYTLYRSNDGINPNVVTAFSLLSADVVLGTMGQLTSLTFDDPIAFVRSEPNSAVGGIVDARSWTPTAPLAPRLFFDACTPGMASGGTLDGDAVLRVFACSNTSLLVVDTQSLYLLSYSGVALCYGGPVADPSAFGGGRLLDAALYNTTAFVRAQNSTYYNITDACSSAATISLFDNVLPPQYDLNTTLFAPSDSKLCEVRLDSTALLVCTDGTFESLISGSLVGALGVAYDTKRDIVWVSFENGTLVLVNLTSRITHTIVPENNAFALTSFLFDPMSGTASWIATQPTTRQVTTTTIATYLWITAVYDNDDLLLARQSQFRTVRLLGNYTISGFGASLATFGPIAVANYTTPSSCWFLLCNDGAFIGGTLLVVLFFGFWVILIVCAAVRRHRRNRGVTFSAINTVDDDSSLMSPESINGHTGAAPPHVRRFKWLREKIRGLFCFCHCCYDPISGLLRCCYPLIGGRWAGHSESRQLQDLGFVHLGEARPPVPPPANAFSLGEEDPVTPPLDPTMPGGDVQHEIPLQGNKLG